VPGSSVWALTSDGTIARVLSPGRTEPVSAIEIWASEFEPLDASSMPSSSLTDLTFSPSFLELSVQMSKNEEGLFVAVLETGAASATELLTWPHADQLIINGRWFAVDLDTVNNFRTLLKTHGIELGVPLTSAQIVWMYWTDELSVRTLTGNEPIRGFVGGAFEPNTVLASLYQYQIEGALFLVSMARQNLGVLLADEMGLGKTLQAIYLLSHDRATTEHPNLVLVPSSLISNWERELAKFAPWMTVLTHRGADRTGDPSAFGKWDVVIVSYEVMTRDVALFESTFWNIFVVDEAQAIKNPNARRTLAAKRVDKRVGVAISGTPIENSLRDLWSIMEFVAPTLLGSLAQFTKRYPDEVVAARSLSRRASPMMIRREVADVAADLPGRIDIRTAIDLGDELASLYEAERTRPGVPKLAMLTSLRQFCSSPSVSSSTNHLPAAAFPKHEHALSVIAEAFSSGAKVILFASFVSTLDWLDGTIRDLFPNAFRRVLDGRTQSDERQHAIDEFTAHDGSGILLMNPRATGVGLNIQAANHVIHFTPEWNPAVVAQATARAHRRGQTRPVFVHYLYYASTVEQAMMDRLESKRDLQDAGLEIDNDSLSNSDILDALSRSPFEGRT
jgi:SNF2 family DNA or RNA helicase